MLTDWVLIARLARELQARLAGARVTDAGLLADGRIGIVTRRGGRVEVMAIDLFSSPPMVTLETTELGIIEEPGFVRALARSLRGMTLTGVRARRFDRLVRLQFAARSRFGVGDEMDLYLELVPRFGNAVLVKNERIIAAAKEFTLAENPRRAIAAGAAYALPPLPERPSTLNPAAADLEASAEPLYAYRRDGRLLQVYVAPLAEYADAEAERVTSLLEVFAEVRARQRQHDESERVARRRQRLLKRLQQREERLVREREALARKRSAAQARETLRAQGEAIYAGLHQLDESEREAAKEQAAALFAQYKRLGKSLPHVAERERVVAAALEVVETMRWETERAGEAELDDVELAGAQFEPARGARRAVVARRRKRRPFELRTRAGSRIIVGRSPLENAELTFNVARPSDLWFHAQGVPGAHVILARDDRTPPPPEDLAVAASLAAFYSKAQRAATAPVDYALRKHVRKQRAAPPGLVWYTHAQTILAAPLSLEALALAQEDKRAEGATPFSLWGGAR